MLGADPRILGIAAGGSFLTNTMDAFSDLDLVVAVDPAHADAVMAERRRIASTLGPLLSAFTGEHVGEPRLLVCLYDLPPLLHVDLKFVALPDLAARVEDPAVLWERDGLMTRALATGVARYPEPDPQWIEDRFWIWVHYGAVKIGRGELFEAIDLLSALRAIVLGPLILREAGGRAAGVRRIETTAPARAEALTRTVAVHDAADCRRALQACAELYRSLRSPAVRPNAAAEAAACRFLDERRS